MSSAVLKHKFSTDITWEGGSKEVSWVFNPLGEMSSTLTCPTRRLPSALGTARTLARDPGKTGKAVSYFSPK